MEDHRRAVSIIGSPIHTAPLRSWLRTVPITFARCLRAKTLAAGLRGLNQELSWAEARRLIHNRHVQVNGNLVLDDARRLKNGDVVKLSSQPRPAAPSERDVPVVHLDGHLIVIDKPAGITTLRHIEEQSWDDRRKQRQPTLDEVVQRLLPTAWAGVASQTPSSHPPGRSGRPSSGPPGIIRRGGGSSSPAAGNGPPPRVRAVHRLDRDTSGLIIFALSPAAERALVAMFKEHTIDRLYHAVVHGQVKEPLRIESRFVRDRGDGLRGSAPPGKAPADAQQAITHVRPLQSLAGGKYTLVQCRLETGRTHQIRIHLAEAGHMLCGERTYLRPQAGAPAVHDQSEAPRQALHSAELAFEHPMTRQAMKFTAPLPRDLAVWIKSL